MGFLRNKIDFRLRYMGFDTRDVMLRVPLQAVWTAIEELDRRLTPVTLDKEVSKIGITWMI